MVRVAGAGGTRGRVILGRSGFAKPQAAAEAGRELDEAGPGRSNGPTAMSTTRSNTDPEEPATASGPVYHRAVLKISGEAFCKPGQFGIDGEELELIAREIAAAAGVGTQLAVVVGGGNMIRGATLAKQGRIDQATADYMGMLGTAINLSAVAETFIRGRAIRHLEKGRVVIFVAGTGNPFFTTDSAASLRAAEIGADVLLKATKVDGVYDKDPHQHDDAVRFEKLTFSEAIARQLKVMDVAAFSMCRDHRIPLVVFDMKAPGHIAEVVSGKPHGTRVEVD